ncbi:hypothetical protein DFQ04_2043 [Algoriphagus boseongensis]|uniref:Uncharacterized protein n=1 Tax=Algoriphagus boseongensis TaxID=1442587 RepID=A0A4V3D288_9BACT|nr:hypothetical protein [Algoriphagus boseongensis]TDQ17390.1 hypothetical protein DFQ04_2043 [Algoriphagus boseongensis]
MRERIEELLQKYWAGESSLAEEKELKESLAQVEGFETEKSFFGVLKDFKAQMPEKLKTPGGKPKSKTIRLQWLSWAASLALIISSVWVWRDYEEKKEQEQAYQEVMEALAMIQTNLAKGQEQMKPLNDLKYLKTTNQLFTQGQ